MSGVRIPHPRPLIGHNMKTLLVALLLLSVGVGAQKLGKYGTDDFMFLQKEIENLTPGVEFILAKNQKEFDDFRKEFLGSNWKNVSAFTLWNEDKGTCKIYIKDPVWKYEPELIGHEVAHCIWGRFHKGNRGLKNY